MEKVDFVGKTLKEIQDIITGLGAPKYNAKEITLWIYKRGAKSFDEMTNLSKNLRQKLNQLYFLGLVSPIDEHISTDSTKKYLFEVNNTKSVEAAYIPETKRNTLCISSQVGCKMGCLFCMTGEQGFQGHLSAGQILNQILSLPERDKITNIVYMGMGEPFDNIDEVLKSLEILTSDYGFGYSPRRITVSTIGLIPGMKRFIEESSCHLAISLHSPFDNERKQLMPVQHVYPVKQVIDLIRSYNFERQRRISFEYILFEGVNNTPNHINEIARLLNGLRCRINLIRFHPIPGTPLKGTNNNQLLKFKEMLEKKHLLTTIRKSRGEDIMAACGLLSTKKNKS